MPTFETYNQNGNREDLLDIIVNISPVETPMLSGFGKGKASGILHEWMTDSLASGGNGRVAEGAAFTAGTLTARTRLGNYTQINRKSWEVSDTLDAVDKAGVNGGEYEYQMAKKMKEIALDMEVDIVSGTSAAGASGGTARAARGVLSFIATNVETGSATGTQALTETLYNDNLQTIFDSGGNPDTTYANGFQKRQISAFTASQTRNIEASAKKLIASIDVYESDFGMQRIILDRYMDTDKVLQLQKDLWKVVTLRPVKHTPIAKVGSSRRGMIESEWTLESLNEAGSGKITELTTA